MMQVESLLFSGVLKITPACYEDARGDFTETWQVERYRALGLPAMVQDNVVRSGRGVLRGLHFQLQQPQGKLVQVLAGAVVDVVVALDPASEHYLQHLMMPLSSRDGAQLYIPPGYAHGYYVLSESALVSYKCTTLYRADDQGGLRWDDPALNIPWPLVGAPVLSARDQQWPLL